MGHKKESIKSRAQCCWIRSVRPRKSSAMPESAHGPSPQAVCVYQKIILHAINPIILAARLRLVFYALQ